MKNLEIRSIVRRKKPPYPNGHKHRIYPNLLKQNFNVATQNTVWCIDFTYLFLKNGKVRYNCSQ